MSEHYAKGENFMTGEVSVRKTQKKKIKFPKPFSTVPNVQITLEDQKSTTWVVAKALDHFWVRLSNKYTGTIAWSAAETA